MIRTGYSFKTAVGHLHEVVSRLRELGWTAAPIADTGNTFGHVSWQKECERQGIRPVFGVELAVATSEGRLGRRPIVDNWVFLAKEKLSDLNDLVALATRHATKMPILTYDEAVNAPGVIKIAQEFCLVDHADYDLIDVYQGLTPATSVGLFRKARAKGALFLAMPRNFYPRETDKELYRVMLTRYDSATQTYPLSIVSDEEVFDGLSLFVSPEEFAAAVVNRENVLAQSTAMLPRAELLKFDSPVSLRQLCLDGAASLGVDLSGNYGERLDRELALIAEKNFQDYFFIITDLVQWARREMIVGPARGSSCGSLVCYLLGITSIDPIPHGLIFERFIDITRADLPDIDIDFSDQHRVIDYAERKYGDRVARLSNVSEFQPRSALNRVGVALRIPQGQVTRVAETAIKRLMGDSRKSSTIADTLTDTDAGRELIAQYPEAEIVARFEAHPDHQSIHAAGLVVTDKPVTTYVAVDSRTKTAMCDKYDAEALNLLKIDALGLAQLAIFGRTMEQIGVEPRGGWLEKLPLDDPKAFEVLNRKTYCGIFQFGENAMKNLAKQITFETFDDIVAAGALVRPGPLASGGTAAWVARRHGQQAVSYPHPLLEEYLSETYGVPVYQEQVLRIGREVGGLDWADVTALRKAMSKSLGKEYFDKFGDRWKASAISKGIPPEVAAKFWDEMCSFGAWAFNKCITGNTRVKRSHGGVYADGSNYDPTIAYLYKRQQEGKPPPWLISLNNEKGLPQQALRIHKNGKKECVRLSFDDGSKVVCTLDHRFMINGRWLACGKSRIGDSFSSLVDWLRPYEKNGRGRHWAPGTSRWDRAGSENMAFTTGIAHYFQKFKRDMRGRPCQRCRKIAKRMEAHHLDFKSGTVRPRDLQWLCVSCHKKVHYKHGRKKQWSHGKVVSFKLLTKIEPAGKRETYDIEMPRHHNFMLANGLVTHNSHSVSYAYVSYWCAYLKAHYPVEFAAATLDSEAGNPQKQIELLRELAAEGIGYVPVDPALSMKNWTAMDDGRLLGPLNNIKGIGPKTMHAVIQKREAGQPLTPNMIKLLTDPKTPIDSLYPIRDRIAKLYPNGIGCIRSVVTRVADIQPGDPEARVVIVTPTRIVPKDENEPVKVARRGYRLNPPTQALNMFVRDDSDEMFAKVDRFKYGDFGRVIQAHGRAEDVIYAFEGTCPPFFRMMAIERYKCLGHMTDDEPRPTVEVE